MEIDNYGSMIKDLRIQNGLTQNQVAESLGVTPGYISNVENNRTGQRAISGNSQIRCRYKRKAFENN